MTRRGRFLRLLATLGLLGALGLGVTYLAGPAAGQVGRVQKCNNLRLVPADTGSNPSLEAYGCDTNISIALTAKGTGGLTGFSTINLSPSTQTAATTTSYNVLAGDFNLSGAWGSSTDADPTYGAGVMGNAIVAANLTATRTMIAGVIGKIDAPAYTFASTYPHAAVYAEIGDQVLGAAATGPFAAVMAVMGGDSGQATTKAMYGVDWQNSTPSTAADFGLDLQGAGTHDGYLAPRYNKGNIRLGGRVFGTAASGDDVVLGAFAGLPTDGASGTCAGDCGPGSLLFDTTNAQGLWNRGTKAAPIWSGPQISTPTQSAATTTSYQGISADFNVSVLWGSSTSADPAYGAGGMFNIIGTGGGSATQNILAGVIGKFDWTGTHLSTYPKGAVIGEIGDTVTGAAATGQFCALCGVMGGDSGVATTKAMFGVDWLNSAPATAADFGLDLQGPGTHDGYLAPRYEKAPIILGGRTLNAGVIESPADVCVMVGTGATTNGTSGTGAGNCGPGSLYIRADGASSTLLINTNTKASPTWSAIP